MEGTMFHCVSPLHTIMDLPLWALVALVLVTVAIPFLYVLITWDHEITASYLALPAPNDLGTKEFRWRCYVSRMTRRGWRRAILRTPCPRITLQSPFALLSTDFAKLTTSLGFQELQLETIPFIFPQIAVSGLFVQLLGNSNFPAALTGIKIKGITICQLQPLDMRFRDKEPSDPPKTEGEMEGLHCLMVLREKRFLETEIEFLIQTDIFDHQGTVWQSSTCLSVPFKQETLLAPLSASAAQLDTKAIDGWEFKQPQTVEYACTPRNLDELEEVSITNFDGTTTNRALTPMMWLVGRTMAALEREKRVPSLPVMCSLVMTDDANAVPIQSRVQCESVVNERTNFKDKEITKVRVMHGKTNIVQGVLRTVGWVFEPETNPSS